MRGFLTLISLMHKSQNVEKLQLNNCSSPKQTIFSLNHYSQMLHLFFAIILIIIYLLFVEAPAYSAFPNQGPEQISLNKKVIGPSSQFYRGQKYSNKMLKEKFKNAKLLEHRIDIDISQQNYQDAIKAFEKIREIKGFSAKDKEFLAFLYSKTGNYTKSLEIIDNQLKNNPKNKQLLDFALRYSLLQKNWDKSILYNDKLLELNPIDEKLLKTGGDLYSIKQDYNNGIKYYKVLVKNYPKLEYKQTLANLYMGNQDFDCAQEILEPLYHNYPENKKIIDAYLNALLAQQKTKEAYWVIKENCLEKTKEGYMVLGDLAMEYQHYKMADEYYFMGLQLDHENIVLKNKLAQAYYSQGYINAASRLYCEVLTSHPNNLDAKIGLGYIEINKKNFEKSREIFCQILKEKPAYKAAQKGIINSYIANGENFKALEILKKMPQDADFKLIKAKIYYKIGMYSDSLKNIPNKLECESITKSKIKKQKTNEKHKIIFNRRGKNLLSEMPTDKEENGSNALKLIANESGTKLVPENTTKDKTQNTETESNQIEQGGMGSVQFETELYSTPTLPEHKSFIGSGTGTSTILQASVYENAQDLKNKIRKIQAITIIPSYSFLIQELADEFKLNYQRFGMHVSQNTKRNANVFMEYNAYIYTSGARLGLTNLTNEFHGGIQQRITERDEYRFDFGVKSFEFGNGAMILSDSWIKHYFNDKFNIKIGYTRNNIEQSYLAAVGVPVDGIFTGRAADNKFYAEFEHKLPYEFYAFGKGAYGVIYAQNLITNQYGEGMIGLGRLLYDNPKNKWVNTFGADITSYNSGYQYNLLRIYDSKGQLFGGYFSPSYFNATTLNLKMEGYIKNWHLKYGLKAFGGLQTSISPDSTTLAWGVSPYFSYDFNDHITLNTSYNFYNYASVQRDYFMVNLIIRGFKKNAKK